MRNRIIGIIVVAAALFLLLVPIVPKTTPSISNCIYCPAYLGIDNTSITYWLLGMGVYHTIWGTFGLSL
jgi:hypothetical protein